MSKPLASKIVQKDFRSAHMSVQTNSVTAVQKAESIYNCGMAAESDKL